MTGRQNSDEIYDQLNKLLDVKLELLDQKISGVATDMSRIRVCIEGTDGEGGMKKKVYDMEMWRTSFLARVGTITVIAGFVFTFLFEILKKLALDFMGYNGKG